MPNASFFVSGCGDYSDPLTTRCQNIAKILFNAVCFVQRHNETTSIHIALPWGQGKSRVFKLSISAERLQNGAIWERPFIQLVKKKLAEIFFVPENQQYQLEDGIELVPLDIR